MYYYAYIENGICIDIERTRTERTDLTDYVQVTENEYNAYMDEDTTSSYYIIGKSWNGSAWVVPTLYYYAILNEKDIAIRVISSRSEINRPNFIPITEDEYNSKSCIKRQWDATAEQFMTVPLSVYADADTTTISVNGSEVPLQTLLNAMQAEIDARGGNVTATDILVALTTVDGAGSGVDSDTLDGFDSGYFARNDDVQGLMIEMDMKANNTDVAAISAELDTKAGVEDLATLATKNDLLTLKSEIITAIQNQTSGSIIKSVQRGTGYLHGGAADITLSRINPNKAFVILNGTCRIDIDEFAYSHTMYIYNLTETVLSIDVDNYNIAEDAKFDWQVIEFY